MDNKKIQYLKYALGEIILVVIGILIALQINNWNQSIKDKKSLNEYLIKIKSHTTEDIEQLGDLARGRKQIADLCKKARNSILNKTENDNLFLFKVSGAAFVDFYFKPNSGGYDVDTPKIRAVSLIIKFTEYDTKKVYPEVQDQSGIGSLKGAA